MSEIISAVNYYICRVDEMEGYSIHMFTALEDWGLKVYLKNNGGGIYQSVYVFEDHRDKGHMKEYVKTSFGMAHRFITIEDCGIEEWFIKHNVDYIKVV